MFCRFSGLSGGSHTAFVFVTFLFFISGIAASNFNSDTVEQSASWSQSYVSQAFKTIIPANSQDAFPIPANNPESTVRNITERNISKEFFIGMPEGMKSKVRRGGEISPEYSSFCGFGSAFSDFTDFPIIDIQEISQVYSSL